MSYDADLQGLIFGKLGLDALPLHEPIVVGTFIGSAVLACGDQYGWQL